MSHKTVFIEMIPSLDSGFFSLSLFDMNSLIGVVNFCRYVFMSALSGAQHIFVGQNSSEVNHSL